MKTLTLSKVFVDELINQGIEKSEIIDFVSMLDFFNKHYKK